MDLKNKNFLVAGLGKTGIESAKFLARNGANIKATDIKPFYQLPVEVTELVDKGYEIETGKHTDETIDWSDTVILSPGISYGTELVQKALRKGKEVISEIELAHEFISKPIIAITGSNGKTTTTCLVGEILKQNGFNVFIGGNIGIPLIEIAGKDSDFDYIVLELSSFQLQGTKSFKPHVAVLLNISPNHLDHHADFNEYLDSKMKIFSNQTINDWSIVNTNSNQIKNYVKSINSNKFLFGNNTESDSISFEEKMVHLKDEKYDLTNMKLIGKHNLENAMCAIAVSKILNCNKEKTVEAIVNFEPLPHRIEFVEDTKGVKVYNDSKSTSPAATLKALESISAPIILLAGGKDKGASYKILKETVRKKVKHLVLFGESRIRMKEEIGNSVNTTLTDTLENAVTEAFLHTGQNDSILFSPACSSFDMFSSYEERGKEFKRIVKSI